VHSKDLGEDDLVVTSSTLGNPPFEELVEVAAAAGFRGLSLWPAHDYGKALAQGASPDRLAGLLGAAGLAATTVDCAVVWAGPDDPGAPYFEEPPLSLLLETADALGAHLVNVLVVGPRGTGLAEAARAVGDLCDVLAGHGLTAMIEFCAGTLARNLEVARSIVATAARPNLGLLVDAWHVHFGAATVAELAALPGQLIRSVQLNDAPDERPEDYAHATRHRRLVPGEGAAELAALLRAVRATGSSCPLTLEVFNAEALQRLGVRRWAERLATSARTIQELSHA